ncbi:unnamed protein product, partial [Amoebophrya sp. A25]|eukprot:GSA25T00020883001.1
MSEDIDYGWGDALAEDEGTEAAALAAPAPPPPPPPEDVPAEMERACLEHFRKVTQQTHQQSNVGAAKSSDRHAQLNRNIVNAKLASFIQQRYGKWEALNLGSFSEFAKKLAAQVEKETATKGGVGVGVGGVAGASTRTSAGAGQHVGHGRPGTIGNTGTTATCTSQPQSNPQLLQQQE